MKLGPCLSCLAVVCVVVLVADESWGSSSNPTGQVSGRRFKFPKLMVTPGIPPQADPPDVAMGERLFLEHRFAQYFAARCGTNVNTQLSEGDPSLETMQTGNGQVPGYYRGLSMSCRACHLVSEHASSGLSRRAYTDYAVRSRVPDRSDGQNFTVRNTPTMVNASIPREAALFLHFDGEFATPADLAIGTFTGRNFGWLTAEKEQAVRHVARVIREDNGQGALASEFGGSYKMVLQATSPTIPKSFRLPQEFRLNVELATDEQIVGAIGGFVAAYIDSLFFSRDELGEYDGSPYDAFLETNRFPRMPDDGQADLYYSRHLWSSVEAHPALKWIAPPTARFQLVQQEFRFGTQELAGMKIFFTLSARHNRNQQQGVGNCVACHAPPHFTDFGFHNTGAAQEEFDAVHGEGTFARLKIPDLTQRIALYRGSATSGNSTAPRRIFMEIPGADRPGATDLGLWNVFGNPDCPLPQATFRRILSENRRSLSDDKLLARTLGMFKTPGLRGLGLSEPYLHTGRKATLESVIQFYRDSAQRARQGTLRNADPALAGVRLGEEDVAPLASFLRSLNEDYE